MITAHTLAARTLAALALAALLSTSASAQERRRDAGDHDKRPHREEILKRFDTNKDGKLDQAERAAARKALAQRGDRKGSQRDEKGTPPKRRGERGERPMSAELLKRFDTNKDGKLDEAERAAARRVLGQQGGNKRSGEGQRGTPSKKRGAGQISAEMLKRFDKNKDGKLDQAERAAARKALGQRGDSKRAGDGERGTPPGRRGQRPISPEMLKRFDKNKDGKLDEGERATARKALGGRQGRGGDGDRRRRAGGHGEDEDGEGPAQRRRGAADGRRRGGGNKGDDQ